jgi:hypothetical protein
MDQSDAGIGFDLFSDQLAPFGYWLYSDRWGLVWQPADVPSDFRPYFSGGHWVYTDDYGWYWQSEQPWGDIAFHYGRWVNDPDDGWLWLPGYVWSPGWVVWRSNGQYIGWMPMPPDDAFLEGIGDIGPGGSFRLGLDVGGLYGYARWYGPEYGEDRFAQNWVFLDLGQIEAPDYRMVAVTNPALVVNIIHNTRNITNYTVINNHVVNRSVDVHVIERAAGHPIAVVPAASVIRHPYLVATVDAGRRVQMQMRMVAPHGTGVANSAPPPPPRVVAKLSTHVPARSGNGPSHLFTRATAAAPEAQSRFHGAPVAHPGGAEGMGGPAGERPHPEQPNGMMGPGAERPHPEQPNGMMGPGAERPHPEQPNGMMGPGAERPHPEQPNGMMGPGAERPHPEQPNSMMGPQGAQHPPAPAAHPQAPVAHPHPPAPPPPPAHQPPKKEPPQTPPQ